MLGGLGVASVAALAACGSDDEGGTGEGGENGGGAAGEAITANGTEPENPLLPSNTNEVGGGRIIQNIYAGLCYYEADGSVQNDLAESIETTDAQNYTIRIRSGQTWSDGTPVTAQDFVDAWNYTALLTNDQLQAYFFSPIQGYDEVQADPPTAETMSGLQVVDDTTFTVALTEPEGDFPLRLGYSAYYPLPPSAYDDLEAFGENPVGNGPYMLAQEGAWQHNVRIDLVPNDSYDGPRAAQNSGLAFIFYESQDAAYADLTSGNLDILDQMPDSALTVFESDLGERAVNQPAAIFQAFTIPQYMPGMTGEAGQLRRRAISLAIDRETICEQIFSGTRTPARDYTSPVINGYSDSIEGNEVLDYDPDQAAQLWQQAEALEPFTGSFDIAYNADGPHQGWVDAVTAGLRQTLGIQSEGRPYATFAQLRSEVNARSIQTAFRSGWQADYPSLYNFLGPNYGTGGSSNDGDYSNPEFDALLVQGGSTTDVDQAAELWNQAQTILFQDLPAIALWYQNVSAGSAETVENVEFGWDSQPLYYEVTKA
ncbi:peptide ABC transporter substrate-binding protein [Kineococcus sp. SYSU DK004]|uniref:peptide ABC transporter substrate-binding protein n=1 Tax=Kineococcus sp. SYSU DK004 TaxID=3383125 RepID=UPI003D7EFCA3